MSVLCHKRLAARVLRNPLNSVSAHKHELPADTHHRDALRAAKLRITDVRIAVLEALDSSDQAITAQQIFDAVTAAAAKSRLPKPDRVTVYRTLNTLVDAGLAHKVDPGDRVFRFSLTSHDHCEGDKHVHEHPHFVCDSCGTVECLDGAEVQIKNAAEAARSRRRVKQQDVTLHGTCEKCVDQTDA